MKARRAPFRPTKEELAQAASKTVPDVIGPGLEILFVGINPGLYSGATRHHFARPGNRFWPALHAGGFTPRVVSPFDEEDLLEWRIGITNMVGRSTNAADELSAAELKRGRRRLEAKVARYRPAWVAVLGITAYRTAFDRPRAALGPQPERLSGARLWVLPNPSGLNAHHTPADLARQFRELHAAMAGEGATSPAAPPGGAATDR
jgi:TDG/mug DNA glycosylase family protein